MRRALIASDDAVLCKTEEQRHERITLVSAFSLQDLMSFTHVVLPLGTEGDP